MSLDLLPLLEPISENNPSGYNIRTDPSPSSLYHQARDKRFMARAIEREQPNKEGYLLALEQWRELKKIAIQVLTTESKDLQVACWLVEALVRENGFYGSKIGFNLIRQLLEKYWNSIFPLLEEENTDEFLSSISGLNGEESEGTLIFPLIDTYITQGKEKGPYTTWQYQQAITLERLSDANKKEQKISEGAITLSDFSTAVKETDKNFFISLREDLTNTINEILLLDTLLTEKVDKSAPSFSQINSSLNTCLESVQQLTKELFSSTQEAIEETTQGSTPEQIYKNSFLINSKSMNRQEAFENILKIAEFFSYTEPHSPISYLLRKAANWGKLSLPEVLGELVDDERSLENAFRLMGIKKE